MAKSLLITWNKGIETDLFAEEFYRSQMRCYRAMDRCTEALAIYARCEKMLATLNTEPGSETRALYRQIEEDEAAGRLPRRRSE